MKIERGIIGFNTSNEMIVQSPGHIYHLNNESFLSRSLKENDKVFGVIIDNKFNICREFVDENGRFIFGFVKEIESATNLKIQRITGFDQNTFNPYTSKYSLGRVSTAQYN